MASRVWRPRLRTVVAAVLLGWLVFAGASLLQAARDFRAGQEAINGARTGISLTTLKEGVVEQELFRAARAFRQGEQRIRHPLILPLRLLPVAGRQLRAASRLGGAAGEVATIGANGARKARGTLADPPGSGAARLAALERLFRISSDAQHALGEVRLGSGEALVAPLANARERLAREIAETQRHLRRAGTVTGGVVQLLRGPRRYLVLASNNAEMRAGSGMFLSAGVLTITGGELHLGEMRSTGELHLGESGVPIGGDQAATWGWTNPGREWRNLAMTPRFDATAPLAARMWAAKTGEHVDGVLALDVVALRSVLTATGAVRVDGVDIGANNVERHLLHDQYEDLADDSSSGDTQTARRDQLSAIAKAAVVAVQGGNVHLTSLAAELAGAAMGRHVLIWSSRHREQAGWQAAKVAGELGSSSVLLAVLNRGANKLDQYLEVDAEIEPRRGPHGREVAIVVHLKNRSPEGDLRYVEGPHPDLGVPAGTYVGLLALTVPGHAWDVTFASGATTDLRGPDGPGRVIATQVRLGRGEEQTVVATFRLPEWQRELLVEPSARVPPVHWRVGSEEWDDTSRRTVALSL